VGIAEQGRHGRVSGRGTLVKKQERPLTEPLQDTSNPFPLNSRRYQACGMSRIDFVRSYFKDFGYGVA
jgi:hypothetical protein